MIAYTSLFCLLFSSLLFYCRVLLKKFRVPKENQSKCFINYVHAKMLYPYHCLLNACFALFPASFKSDYFNFLGGKTQNNYLQCWLPICVTACQYLLWSVQLTVGWEVWVKTPAASICLSVLGWETLLSQCLFLSTQEYKWLQENN